MSASAEGTLRDDEENASRRNDARVTQVCEMLRHAANLEKKEVFNLSVKLTNRRALIGA